MTTQISKIQLRRGLQSDLPGATTSGLDVGEVAFASDTNRLFIGTDRSAAGTSAGVERVHDAQNPNNGGFPYSNVEILTEFSPANQAVFDAEARNITSAFLVSTPLVLGNVWQPIMIMQISSFAMPAEPQPFVINAQSRSGQFGAAQISYHILDQDSAVPLRTGRLTVFYQGNAFAQPQVTDEAVCNPYAGVSTGGLPVDPNERYGMIAFKVEATPDGLQLHYQVNLNGDNLPQLVMHFRVEQPAPREVSTSSSTNSTQPVSNAGATTIININANLGLPYDIVGAILDPLYADEVFFRFVFVRSVSFEAGLPKSLAICLTPATNPVSFIIALDGATIGSIDFTPHTTDGAFSFPSTRKIMPGQVMTMIAPSIPDPTLATVSYTIFGTIVP